MLDDDTGASIRTFRTARKTTQSSTHTAMELPQAFIVLILAKNAKTSLRQQSAQSKGGAENSVCEDVAGLKEGESVELRGKMWCYLAIVLAMCSYTAVSCRAPRLDVLRCDMDPKQDLFNQLAQLFQQAVEMTVTGVLQEREEAIQERDQALMKLADMQLEVDWRKELRPVCCPECGSTDHRCAVCKAEWREAL
jgi:hypothetical protein